MTRLIIILVVSSFIVSCANMASPTGGSYDLDPPKVVKSSPAFNSLNVSKSKIEIVFDELVQLEKPSEKIIITPPQYKMPLIQAISNRVSVELKDTLLPNTTYTIDFTDAIKDYNEGNPLDNFSISFSTGEVLDSLIVSGKILAANNLEPVAGMYVGLHSDLSDSAFLKKPFLRISRTSERGTFFIKGIAPGEYRIYGLNDINRDYMYDNPTEAIAFSTSIIVPSFEAAVRTDTLFKKDLSVDTVKEISYTRFFPDDLLLRSFTSGFLRQYLVKHERPAPELFTLTFSAPTQLPKLEPLNFDPPKSSWLVTEGNPTNDTLNYWITDPTVSQRDTLTFKISYLKTDSTNKAVEFTDTLHFIDRTKKSRKPKEEEEAQIDFLKVTTNTNGNLEIYERPRIEFAQPLSKFEENGIKLSVKVDTLYKELPIKMVQDSINKRLYYLTNPLELGGNYSLQLDSAAVLSISGKWNNLLENKFQVKTADEYGNFAIAITGLEKGEKAFIELLDQSDNPIISAPVLNNEALFPNLKPSKYYFRLIVDDNNNGKWDTGDYHTLTQPERVYYYPQALEVRANWDTELDTRWDINAKPFDQQKPLEITKNKPQDKDQRQRQMKEEEARRGSKKSNEAKTQPTTGNPNMPQNTPQGRNRNQ